jgi:peptidyl-prolyl cis-trans isomerase C
MSVRNQKRLALCGTLLGLLLVLTSCSRDSKDLVASVNGIGITREKLESSIESARAQYASIGRTIAESDEISFRSEVLENLIGNALLFEYAEENGYSVDQDSVNKELSEIEAQFESKEDFLSALENRGITEKALRDEIRTGITIERMIETEVFSEIEITDKKIAEFYAENNEYFETGESVTASHILIAVDPEDTDEEKEDALGKMESIRQEIVDGADFAEVARAKSEGPSGPRGGSLGTFTRGQMVGPFEEAAFALEPGELSEVVFTRFGYHIIFVEAKTAPSMRPLSEVSDQISQYLTGIEEQDVTASFIAELKEKATIEYFD